MSEVHISWYIVMNLDFVGYKMVVKEPWKISTIAVFVAAVLPLSCICGQLRKAINGHFACCCHNAFAATGKMGFWKAHFTMVAFAWLALRKALTASLRSRMSLGDMDNKARKICNAWLVGREQTKWTQDWFLGWKKYEEKPLKLTLNLNHFLWVKA